MSAVREHVCARVPQVCDACPYTVHACALCSHAWCVCTVCRVHTLHTYMVLHACVPHGCTCVCALALRLRTHRTRTAHTVSVGIALCVHVPPASADAVCYLRTHPTHSMLCTGEVSVHCADRRMYGVCVCTDAVRKLSHLDG